MEDYQVIAHRFRELKHTVSSFLMQVLPGYDITPMMMYTLEFLRKHPDSRAVDISDEIGLTRGAVTQLLDRLEQQGLVVRKPHPTSRRSLQVEITEMGYQLLDKIIKEYDAKIESLLTNYTKEELNTLKILLLKMNL